MRLTILVLALALAGCGGHMARSVGSAGNSMQPSSGYTVTATHTGQSQLGYSVTGQPIANCQYRTQATTFWRTIAGYSCPPTLQVQ